MRDDPTRDMLEAGAEELASALPPGSTPSYRRELAGVIWRAMQARGARRVCVCGNTCRRAELPPERYCRFEGDWRK